MANEFFWATKTSSILLSCGAHASQTTSMVFVRWVVRLFIKSIVPAIFASQLAGCVTGQRIDETPSASAVIIEPKARSCLAMSGGGIRSGAVSLGILQGLHAEGTLADFDYVSTVSGGGYPVYGLLDRILRKKRLIADLLQESGDFISDVEEESSFIGTADIYSGAILGPTLWAPLTWMGATYGAARPTYEAQIHHAFTGHLKPLWGLPELEDASASRKLGFPAPIFGTAANIGYEPPASGHVYHYDDYFELSPRLSGSPAFGYFTTMASEIEIIEAVAMSAAAIDTPQGEIQLPDIAKIINLTLGGRFRAPTKDGEPLRFYLADGGFIENLGLLPLLRRGCERIIAFDNSDEENVAFDVWRTFARRVEVEERPWTVTRPLRAPDGAIPPEAPEERWVLPSHIWDAQLQGNNLTVEIRLVKLGINKFRLNQYPITVQEFARENWGQMNPGCENERLKRRCSFPLEATARQSFEEAEFRAYRHLGIWLAEKAIQTPNSRGK